LNKPQLDIVLPCYNPAKGWTAKVTEGFRQIQALLPGVELHFILVNDGSSRAISQEDIDGLKSALPAFTYLSYTPNRGKGHALRRGVAASRHACCIFTDVDFPYTPESLVRIYRQLEAGETDVAVGIKDARYYAGIPVFRRRISKLLRWLIRTFLRISITDTQCGLKGFNQRGKEVFLQTTIDRYLADLEFIFLADRTPGLRMQAIAVELKPDVVFSQVSWKILLMEGMNFSRVFLRSLITKKTPAKQMQAF